MSDSRKEFEAALAKTGERLRNFEIEFMYRGWQLSALSAPHPAPVAEMWLLRIKPSYQQGRGKYERAEHRGYTDDILHAGRFTEEWAKKCAADCPDKLEAIPDPYAPPLPAQQGDVADEAKFDELLSSLCKTLWKDVERGRHCESCETMQAIDAIRQHFKQSRPAAPAQAMQEGITLNVQEVQAVALWAIAARQRGCVSDDDEFLVARLQSALSTQAGSEA